MLHSNSVYFKKQSGNGLSDIVYKKMMKTAGVQGVDTLFKGEKHAPLVMPDGTLRVGNYIGPGTQAPTRVNRGDRGITPVDTLAMRHDALYSLAKTKKDIRLADEDFLRILKKGVIKDHPMNLRTGELGIASKYAAESGRGGVRFPNKKELNANNANDPKLLSVIRDTDRLYGVQSGRGLMDILQKIVNWIFGTSKVPNYNIPPQEPRTESPLKTKCKMLLEKHGIVDNRSFKRWALRNHPDKVSPDKVDDATELFKQIKNCMDEEQIGQGFWDNLEAGFNLAGDIATGIVKDPIGAVEMIGDTFSKKDIWDAADKYFREDESFQKALGITTAITDKLEKVLGAIPGVGEISDVVFKGWDKLTGEFKAKPGATLTNNIKKWGEKADEWDRIRRKHPDIGGGLLDVVFYWFKKLGATKYKQKLPEILKDHQRRVLLFNKYLEQDIKDNIKKLTGEAVSELATNRKGRSSAILKAIKAKPSAVSPEFHIELFNYMRTNKSKNDNIKEAKKILQPRNYQISSQVFKLDKQQGRL